MLQNLFKAIAIFILIATRFSDLSGQVTNTRIFFREAGSGKPAIDVYVIFMQPTLVGTGHANTLLHGQRVDSSGIVELKFLYDSIFVQVSSAIWVQKQVIQGGVTYDTVDVYTFRNCPITLENTIPAPSALHDQLIGYWTFMPDELDVPSYYYKEAGELPFFRFKDDRVLSVNYGKRGSNFLYSLHEENSRLWLQLAPIVSSEYPFIKNSSFDRFVSKYSDRYFIQFIGPNSIHLSIDAWDMEDPIHLIRARGVLPEKINYRKEFRKREFIVQAYGYIGDPDRYDIPRPYDKFNVYFVNSRRMVYKYRREYNNLNVPIRFYDEAKTSVYKIKIRDNAIFMRPQKSEHPLMKIYANHGIGKYEFRIYDMNNHKMLQEWVSEN